jgi:hypothetical protein
MNYFLFLTGISAVGVAIVLILMSLLKNTSARPDS